ncbi:MAG TPA: hypothetical protein VER79_07900 [Candidatus Limnocylindrales bacterium]|nr:hypothetical protein [Candidatus Limnocylindrales bacterium]
MSLHSRADKLARAAARSSWLIELAPRVSELPGPIQKYDDPFLPYSRTVIQATSDLVAGYVFDFAAYMTLGAAGAIALERSVALAAADDACLTVLHGPFARGEFAALAAAGALNVAAATVTSAAVAEAFAAQGVCGLVVMASADAHADCCDGATVCIDGAVFRVLRQSFLDEFKRDDFGEALHAAVIGLPQ